VNPSPRSSAPSAVSVTARRVTERLDQLLSPEGRRWGAVDDGLVRPYEVLRAAVLDGGKRLRPAFCYWAFVGAGGDPEAAAVIDAGAALELLHAAALLHDDVIDDSTRRRGQDTAHVKLAGDHRAAGWRGDPDRFGSGAAILLGDLALIYSRQLLRGTPPEALAIYDEVGLEVNVGQYLDILGAAQSATMSPAEAVQRAERIRRYKTARYTVERPLHLGVAIAAPARLNALRGPLSAFGMPLGEAFQLRDDLLGVFGDPDTTGKPVGDDLRDGKITMLVGLARARATGQAAELLERRFGAADLSDTEAAELAEVVERTGARADVEATIDRLVTDSREALHALPFGQLALDALADLVSVATARDR
jgi:geranylgeranyl diphosphate synthase type I